MEIIKSIDDGIKSLKEKNVRQAVESFGNAMAQSGKNLEEEVRWVGERGLELVLNTRIGIFANLRQLPFRSLIAWMATRHAAISPAVWPERCGHC